MRFGKKLATSAAGVGVIAAAALVTAAPALADGSTGNESICGGVGNFKTVSGVAQVQYIADTHGVANSAHNGGCFGIGPNSHIYWIPLHGSKWVEMPGGGRAQLDIASDVEDWDIGGILVNLQTVEVKTAAGGLYKQPYDHGWVGHWYHA